MGLRTLQRRFGAFDLDGTNGIAVQTWRCRVMKSNSFSDRLVADGAVATKDRFTGQRVDVRGDIKGVDTEDLRDKLDALISALSNGEQNLRLYADRQLQCRVVGNIEHKLITGSGGVFYRWTAGFRSRLPWWEATSTTTNNFTPSGAGPHTMVTSNPGGTAPTFPTVKITNDGPSFSDEILTLTNVNTTQQVQLLGLSLNSGDFVVVDMLEGWLGDGQSATPVSPFAIDGQFWSLQPAAANTIELEHSVGGSAAWDIEISYTPAFWQH